MVEQADSNRTVRRKWWHLSTQERWAILAGLMVSTALPPFVGTGWLMPIGLALLFNALRLAQSPARAGWLFGLAHQASLLYWLYLLIPAASVPSPWLKPGQATAAILYVSVYYLLFGWLFRWVRRWIGGSGALALAPVLWTVMEFCRTRGELGFPWCLIGAAWIESPLLRLAAASGEVGLSVATSMSAASLAALVPLLVRNGAPQLRDRAWRLALAGATALLWLGLLIGSFHWATPVGDEVVDRSVAATGPEDSTATSYRVGRTSPIRVAAIQADVSLDDKWQRVRIDSTKVPYTDLTMIAAEAGAELIVWAETAIPAYVIYDRELYSWLKDLVAGLGIYLYTGFPDARLLADGRRVKYNSSGLFGPDGTIQDYYAKHHLLPIGESMPFQKQFPFLGNIDVGQAEWSPGEPPGPISVSTPEGVFRFSGLICFESIFADLARQAVRNGTQLLVNITNDGWFGKTAGPKQHAAMARLRAVECGVPLVRCANNGISFICDDRGTILTSAALGERRIVIADIRAGWGRTLFVRYGAWPLTGFLVVWTCLALCLTRVRGKRSSAEASER